jgi:hypothetical protein
MKQIPTSAQENSLRKLLTGNHIEREQIISLQRPEMRPRMRKFIKAKRYNEMLVEILLSDLSCASKQVKEKPSDQFLRRMTVRCFAAAVDGIVFGLKQLAQATGELTEYKFTPEELFLLTEVPVEIKGGKKPRFPVFRDNIKQTFKLFAKVYGTVCPTDFNQSGFNSMCETFELRHRLMHPKSYVTFCVTDDEKQKCSEAAAWLHSELNRLLDSCNHGIAKS